MSLTEVEIREVVFSPTGDEDSIHTLINKLGTLYFHLLELTNQGFALKENPFEDANFSKKSYMFRLVREAKNLEVGEQPAIDLNLLLQPMIDFLNDRRAELSTHTYKVLVNYCREFAPGGLVQKYPPVLVGDLVLKPENDFCNLSNVGKKSLDNFNKCLEPLGLKVGMKTTLEIRVLFRQEKAKRYPVATPS